MFIKTLKKNIHANICTMRHDLSREFDDNSSLLGHDTMQTGIQLSAFCSRLMSPSSETKSKKTLICQSKQHYIPKGLNLQQHHCQNQKFCRDFINRGKHCDVYISSGIVRILTMETRWVEHVAWMQKRKEVGIWYLIYLLTAIGLPHGGSSTAHIYTQTIHRTTQKKNNT